MISCRRIASGGVPRASWSALQGGMSRLESSSRVTSAPACRASPAAILASWRLNDGVRVLPAKIRSFFELLIF